MTRETPAYLPIADYGAIGDLRTMALVGRNGSIDWCCFPRFDSPSLFAGLLDHRRGGCFQIAPAEGGYGEQRYLPDTNVLQTIFTTARGRLTVTDFMPLAGDLSESGGSTATGEILRVISPEGEDLEVQLRWAPRFDYARAETKIELRGDTAVATGGGATAALVGLSDRARIEATPFGPQIVERIVCRGGEPVVLACRWGAETRSITPDEAEHALAETTAVWREWVAESHASGEDAWAREWRDLVIRSSLALKLLIHEDSGHIVAAPTTSLPEEIGGVRNWDYRYSWIRDAAKTANALFGMGHARGARDYLHSLERTAQRQHEERTRAGESPGFDIRLMYTLDDERVPGELTLDHLEGYRGSRPVRIGNDAADQIQLDIYGEVLEAAYQMVRAGERLSKDMRRFLQGVADAACSAWHNPDHGIWEVRQGKRHYVHSKLMVWVALDRAIRLVDRDELSGDRERWQRSARAVRQAILERGFDEEIGSFVQAFGSRDLDATSLLIPAYGLLEADDPLVEATIERTRAELMEGGLVYRYSGEDGLPGSEGAFGLCTFWMVDALTLSGRIDEAQEIFDGLARRANHVGLFSEEIDPSTGEFLGNFPQAYTHIGLINAALGLAKAKGRRVPETEEAMEAG